MMSYETLYLLMPEIVLIAVATMTYLGGAFTVTRSGSNWFALGGILLATVTLYRQDDLLALLNSDIAKELIVSGPLVIDALSQALRWAALAMGFLFVLVASRPGNDAPSPEYIGSLLLVVAGLMLLSSANELVLIFLALELISIPTYVLLYLGRRNNEAQEAATKYFFLSILASALLLYGFSLIYGVAGSTSLIDLRERLAGLGDNESNAHTLAQLALVMVLAGLGFRLTAAPFHFYAPDVYQGTSNPNAALLATLPKAAAIVLIVRLLDRAMPGMERLGWQITLALSVVTMTVGNIVALWQDNLRRLMAYSSIAHAGYMLIGLSVGFAGAGGSNWALGLDGIAATLFYLVVYVLSTVGTFAALTYLGRVGHEVQTLDELAGVGRTHPAVGAAVSIFMFSLTGIPPLAGFWGKFVLIGGALDVDIHSGTGHWFLVLAVIAMLNAAISAAYYLRVVAVMYFRAPLAPPRAEGGFGAYAAMTLCAVFVVGLGILPAKLIQIADLASEGAIIERAESPDIPTMATESQQPAILAE